MTKAAIVCARLGPGDIAMLDDVIIYLQIKAREIMPGLQPTRSDALRVCLSQWAEAGYHEKIKPVIGSYQSDP